MTTAADDGGVDGSHGHDGASDTSSDDSGTGAFLDLPPYCRLTQGLGHLGRMRCPALMCCVGQHRLS
jgi:hypothetical protein